MAYVDEQSAEQMRANRGDFTTPGTDSSVFRSRTHEREPGPVPPDARRPALADGAMVLRAKVDLASAQHQPARPDHLPHPPRGQHHNTGDRWCIYPMYAYAHPIEDALEQITHSICTLEFEDQRPWYDWLLERPDPPSAC
jgi:glutaminyl-tRNA synthetase